MQMIKRKIWREHAWAYSLVSAGLPLLIPCAWHASTVWFDLATDAETMRNFLWCAAIITSGLGLALALYNERRVRTASERDPLTGLLNQNGFVRTTKLLLELCARHEEPLSVMMMDLDHFKQVNDKNNHLVGSHVIKETGKLIAHNMRKSDVSARFGGDEYVVCLPKTGPREARLAAERLRRRLEKESFHYKQTVVQVTVSIGVATIRGHTDLGRLLEEADAALYRAKANGRNRVEVDEEEEEENTCPIDQRHSA